MSCFVGPARYERIDEYAIRLSKTAVARGTVVQGAFNGTPVTVRPGMSGDDAFMNWHTRREALQGAMPVLALADLRAKLVDRSIISVAAAGADDIRLTLDDGTIVVATGVRAL